MTAFWILLTLAWVIALAAWVVTRFFAGARED